MFVTLVSRVGVRRLNLLLMQIATISGNAWALALANSHCNNKGGLPLSVEAN